LSRILLGLGSNTAYNGCSPVGLLGRACTALSGNVADIVCSSVYRTKAMYVTEQDDFYNMAVKGTVENFGPRDLLAFIHRIEASLGRNRNREYRFGPRTLDIDIELFGTIAVDEPDLQIPHPRIHERGFVLVPALEILTEPADCIERERFSAYVQNLSDPGVRLFLPASDFRKAFFPEAANGTE